MTEEYISRRTVIAGAAAMTCSTPSLAEAPGLAEAPDPIFPVLGAFRLAETALSDAIKAAGLPQEQWLTPTYVEANGKLKSAYAIFNKAQLDLLTTMPTTRAGLAALLIRLGQPTHSDQPSDDPNLLVETLCWHDEPTREAACTVLNRLATLVLKIA